MQIKRRVLSVEVKGSTLMSIFDFLDLNNIEAKSMASAISAFLQFHVELYRKAEKLPTYESEGDCELLLADRVEMIGKVKRQRQLSNPMQINVPAGSAVRGISHLREAIHNEAVTDSDFAPSMSFNSISEQKLGCDSELENILKGAESLTVNDYYPSQSEQPFGFDDLDLLLHREIAEQQMQEEQDLLAKITLGSVASSSVLTKPEPKIKVLEEMDSRLQKDKFWNIFSAEENKAKCLALRIVYFHLPHEHWSTKRAEELLLSILSNLNKQGE